jgi:hypothetical protein
VIESFSDVILIAKILLTFLSRIDRETLSKIYKFGNLPNFQHDVQSKILGLRAFLSSSESQKRWRCYLIGKVIGRVPYA